jgi:carboxyl-terminal processing protease
MNLEWLWVYLVGCGYALSIFLFHWLAFTIATTISGDRTFGKPVGQVGLEFCDKILRPTSFKLANALGDGDYFDGLPVDCPAADDLSFEIGADLDPNMIAAMTYLDSGACPVASMAPGTQLKSVAPSQAAKPELHRPPHRELIDAY